MLQHELEENLESEEGKILELQSNSSNNEIKEREKPSRNLFDLSTVSPTETVIF